ncbi:MAG: hypothetical protein QOD04_2238, partial [Pseudonocardiales bacterium]|nr:hypothetical protein [Pseudonocardiales bacterium]
GVRRESADSLDLKEPVASLRQTDAPATEKPLPELPVAEILTVFAAELVGTGQRAQDGAVSYAK